MASPAIGTSLIFRVETQNSANAFSSLASAIGDAGGTVSAIDTHAVGTTSTVRDVTVSVKQFAGINLEDISAPRSFDDENAVALTVR